MIHDCKNKIVTVVTSAAVCLSVLFIGIAHLNKMEKFYTVTFDSNGGTPIVAVQVQANSKLPKPIDPTKNGYNFEEWSYDNDTWDFSNDVVTKDVTLVADWQLIEYSITYNLNGGYLQDDAVIPSSYTVETETFSLPAPTKDQYNSCCWKNSNGETVTQVEKGSMGDLLLDAAYDEIITYSITYDLKGGEFPTDSNVIYSYNVETETFALVSPVKAYYGTSGWKIKGTDTVITQINKGTIGDIELEAYYGNATTYSVYIACDMVQGYTYINGEKVQSTGPEIEYKIVPGESVTIEAVQTEWSINEGITWQYWLNNS